MFFDKYYATEYEFNLMQHQNQGTYNFKYEIYNNEGYYTPEVEGEVIIKCSDIFI